MKKKFQKNISIERAKLLAITVTGKCYELKVIAEAFGYSDPLNIDDMCEYDSIRFLQDELSTSIVTASDEDISYIYKYVADEGYLIL